jgi:hypothetical protein
VWGPRYEARRAGTRYDAQKPPEEFVLDIIREPGIAEKLKRLEKCMK